MFYTSFEHNMFCRWINSDNSVGTILYIHGLGESSLCFESLIQNEHLCQWSHIALDLEGYGKSLWSVTPKSLEEHADSLARWLQFKSISQVIILGHSMGGVIGLILSEKYPELVQSFINVEGNISIEDCTFSSQAASYSLQDFQRDGFDTIRNCVYSDGLEDPALRSYYPSLCLCQQETYYSNSKELVELSRGAQLAKRLGNLEIPLIYLLGNPRGTAELSRSMLTASDVEWRVIENAGHWPFIDQPKTFVNEMLCFLSQLPK
ncbi:alpha/beta hydrolase fold protein [Kalymmatonema gypsitolerans NIES-4073]|nr:alpha/beta hydrolase fold protein [Scytonema sp. NIES-4073]